MDNDNELEMSNDQICQELAPVELFTQDVTDTVKELYNPIFSKIRIYGDIYDPVFVAKDVQEVLGLSDLNYKREGVYEWGTDKVKIKVQTRGGKQDAIALTEHGLYRAIWHSKTEMAKNFQTFMKVVMRRLRMTGVVTIEDATNDYKEENTRLKAKMRAFEMQWEFEHKELMRLRESDESKFLALREREIQVYKLNEKIKNMKEPTVGELQERVDRIERKYMRPVVVMLSAPPKEHEEVHEYQLEYFDAWDEDLLDPSETMIYSIGTTPLKSKVAIAKLYFHRDIKLDDIHKKLELYRLPKETSGTFYQNQYEISLDLLKLIKDDLNREHESSWD